MVRTTIYPLEEDFWGIGLLDDGDRRRGRIHKCAKYSKEAQSDL
jgi:hypothetical protein